MRTRPAAKIVLPFVAGILVGFYFNVPIWWAVLFLSVFLVALYYFHFRSTPYFFLPDLILILAISLVGLVRYEFATHISAFNAVEKFANLDKPVYLYGTVVRAPDLRPNRINLVVQVDSLTTDSLTTGAFGRTLISLYKMKPDVQYGDHIRVRGDLITPTGPRNPGDFDYKKYLAARNITTLLRLHKCRYFAILSHGNGSWFFKSVIYPTRSYILLSVDKYLSGEQAALLKGLLVGARGEIPRELSEAFSKTGVIHVLAVSGLHVGFIVLILMAISSLLRLPKRWKVVLALLGLFIYVFLTEAKPPVVRASIMAAIILIGTVLQRRSDIFNNLSFAAVIILMIDPRGLFEPGFQLSFTAVFAIAFLYQRIVGVFKNTFTTFAKKESTFSKYLLGLFFVSLAAQLGTLPLTAYYFNRIPIISLLANLLVVPGVGLIVALGFVTTLFSTFSEAIAGMYANANWFLISSLIHIVNWSADLPFAYLTYARPTITHMLAFYSFIGFLFSVSNTKMRKYSLICLLVLCNLIIWKNAFIPKNELTVLFFDVGQGDSAFIEFPNGKTMLIDAGEKSQNYDVGKRVIAPYLIRNGHRKIDVIQVSHPHSDHLGGVPYLLRHFKVGRVIDSGYNYSSELYKTYLHLTDSLNIPLRHVTAGDTISGFGAVSIYVLHPTPEFIRPENESGSEVNNCSVTCKLSYGETEFLFTGDVQYQAECSMLRYGDLLKSEVLKVGHHGSITSSTSGFIKKVAPNYGIVPVGRHNKYHLPSRKRLAQLRDNNMIVYRTDLSGAVLFKSDGNKVRFVDWRSASFP